MVAKTRYTDMSERYLKFKGFRDVHVHFRDPGVPAAETRASGAAAAAIGGFVCVTTMPNTTPAGDSVAWIREQIEDASLPVRIAPSACISKGRLGFLIIVNVLPPSVLLYCAASPLFKYMKVSSPSMIAKRSCS